MGGFGARALKNPEKVGHGREGEVVTGVPGGPSQNAGWKRGQPELGDVLASVEFTPAGSSTGQEQKEGKGKSRAEQDARAAERSPGWGRCLHQPSREAVELGFCVFPLPLPPLSAGELRPWVTEVTCPGICVRMQAKVSW